MGRSVCHHFNNIVVSLDLLRLTVDPDASESEKPSPAGTVKPFMTTFVQLFAAETSSKEFIVAVQLDELA